MSELTCVIIGGGYAGIHAIKSIQRRVKHRSLRIILIDPMPHHIRKVLLFKPAAATHSEIRIPWKQIFPMGVDVLQGLVSGIDYENKLIRIHDKKGMEHHVNYDIAVIAVGSIVQEVHPTLGGLTLSCEKNAQLILQRWQENMQQAMKTENQNERQRLLTITIIGAGISGIETSAALAEKMREAAECYSIHPNNVNIILINSKDKLFPEGPDKVGKRLEEKLNSIGVIVLHHERAIRENAGMLELEGGGYIPTGLTIWTTGLIPNPSLAKWGVPLTNEGRVKVDESYRVTQREGIYSIGDCTKIYDPKTMVEDTMTCKEATIQARRLGKIIQADLSQRKAPKHRTPIKTYCFGLGDKQGLVWVKLSPFQLIFSGKLGLFIRKITWDIASLIK
ncbi:NAD(P)/FAD-dependent oxidoreductase [Ornithinibacillus scapharcae]|uniref:NAD(P)/FAD-dependent oxidoreductase n=1 Tax=Ornithinibacillus scapharcae TaxID=1147159 RepID=UPI000225B020|nr:FAD-dependent oxidoreductase [Ornithinibacillus scapharcae]